MEGANNSFPFSYFDKIVVLNLKSRPDRKAEIEKQLSSRKINRVSFFEGFTGGASGFNKSMFEILNQNQDVNRLLVLEDDAYFTKEGLLGESIRQMPHDWDLLSMGSNLITKHKRVKRNLVRLEDAWMTHSVAYSNKLIKWIVANYRQDLIYDEWLRINVYKQFECFMTYPIVAWQNPSYSDIWSKEADYLAILNKTYKYIK